MENRIFELNINGKDLYFQITYNFEYYHKPYTWYNDEEGSEFEIIDIRLKGKNRTYKLSETIINYIIDNYWDYLYEIIESQYKELNYE